MWKHKLTHSCNSFICGSRIALRQHHTQLPKIHSQRTSLSLTAYSLAASASASLPSPSNISRTPHAAFIHQHAAPLNNHPSHSSPSSSNSRSNPSSAATATPQPKASRDETRGKSKFNPDLRKSKPTASSIPLVYQTCDSILSEEQKWQYADREKLEHIRPMQKSLIKMFDELITKQSSSLPPTMFIPVLRALRVWPHENRESAARVFGAYHQLRKVEGMKATNHEDTAVYNAMLTFFCRAHLPHECAKLLTNMKRYERKASGPSVTVSANPSETQTLYARPDQYSYQQVITAFVAAATSVADKSLDLDPKSEESDSTSKNAAPLDLNLLEATKLWQEVCAKFSESITPDLYTDGLWMYSKHPVGTGFTKCMSLVREMRSKGMKLEAAQWNPVYNAALVAREYSFILDGPDSVQQFIPNLQPVTPPSSAPSPSLSKVFPLLNLFISALSETGRIQEAYRYVQLLEGHGVKLQLETYHRFTRAVDQMLQKERETAGMRANSSELHKTLVEKADSLTLQLLGSFMQETKPSSSDANAPRRAHLQAETLGATGSRLRSIMYFLLRAGRQHHVHQTYLKVAGKGKTDSASSQATMHAFAKLLWESDLIFVTHYAGGADKLCNALRSEFQLEPTQTIVNTPNSRGQSFVIRVSAKELQRWLKKNLTFLERKLANYASILE